MARWGQRGELEEGGTIANFYGGGQLVPRRASERAKREMDCGKGGWKDGTMDKRKGGWTRWRADRVVYRLTGRPLVRQPDMSPSRCPTRPKPSETKASAARSARRPLSQYTTISRSAPS